MFAPDQYQLIDFGQGRRLERFGSLVLDRPCPAAEHVPPRDPPSWRAAQACFRPGEDDQGRWTCRGELPERWSISHGPVTFELKRAPAGHVGVFPEQAENWDWIVDQLRAEPAPGGVRLLNLFAYSGGGTLTAAAAGAEVVHVDAARNTVAWARRNAELSGMSGLPIRWIAEDAVKFAKRELRRGNRYDAVVLDPPSYGHGPRGEVWRLSKHLPRLLEISRELTAGRRRFMVLSCHTPGFGPARLETIMSDALGETEPGTLSSKALTLDCAAGGELPSGVVVRWQADG